VNSENPRFFRLHRLLPALIGAAALWLVFFLLGAVACEEYDWGVLLPARVGVCRVTNLATLVFALPAAILVPEEAHHYGVGHWVLRAGFFALFFVALVVIRHSLRAKRREKLVAKEGDGAALTRRESLSRIGDVALIGGVGAVGSWTALIEPGWLRLQRYEVTIRGLPQALDGLRIAHLSDTHFGPYIGVGHIREAIELANDQTPDLAVLTGDYVHRSPDTIAPGIAIFAELRARHGTVAVLGNHDHWEGADGCRESFRRAGIPMLDNTHLVLTPAGLGDREEVGESLAICGVGDLWEDLCDHRVATQGLSGSCPRLLLSHNPDAAEVLWRRDPEVRIDLQFSGHTHGGQVSLPVIGAPIVPSQYGSKYCGGLVEGPAWPVIVSRAVGMTIAPVRLGVRPEVGLIVLRRG
jgi:hypothetical protein